LSLASQQLTPGGVEGGGKDQKRAGFAHHDNSAPIKKTRAPRLATDWASKAWE